MAVSADDFRQGMRRLGGAVTIVATASETEQAGLTATAVTSLSAEPPRLLACINRAGKTFEILTKGRNLSVNVLSVADRDLAIRFAGLDGSEETERFSEGDWRDCSSGAPYLSTALVSFGCHVETILDAGSHGIVIGSIETVHLPSQVAGNEQDLPPLFYMDGEWSSLMRLESD